MPDAQNLLAVTLAQPITDAPFWQQLRGTASDNKLAEDYAAYFRDHLLAAAPWLVCEVQLVEGYGGDAPGVVYSACHDLNRSLRTVPIRGEVREEKRAADVLVKLRGLAAKAVDAWNANSAFTRDSAWSSFRDAFVAMVEELGLPAWAAVATGRLSGEKPNRANVPKADEPRRVMCDSCDWYGLEDELGEIHDFTGRVEAGGEVPAGECPCCRALAYLDIPSKAVPLVRAVVSLSGGVVNVVEHDGKGFDLEVVFLETDSDAVDDDFRVARDAYAGSYVYTYEAAEGGLLPRDRLAVMAAVHDRIRQANDESPPKPAHEKTDAEVLAENPAPYVARCRVPGCGFVLSAGGMPSADSPVASHGWDVGVCPNDKSLPEVIRYAGTEVPPVTDAARTMIDDERRGRCTT